MNKKFIALALFVGFSAAFANATAFVPKKCTFTLTVKSASNDMRAKRFIATMSDKTRSWQSRGYKDIYNNFLTFLSDIQAAVANGINLVLTPTIEETEITDASQELSSQAPNNGYISGNFYNDQNSMYHPELPYTAEIGDWQFNQATQLWEKIQPAESQGDMSDHVSFSFNIFAQNEQGLSVYEQVVAKLNSIVQSLPSLSDIASAFGSIFNSASEIAGDVAQQASQVAITVYEQGSEIAAVVADNASQVASSLADQASQIAATVYEQGSEIAVVVVDNASQIASNLAEQASSVAVVVSEQASVAADYVAQQISAASSNATPEATASTDSDNVDSKNNENQEATN